MTVEGNFTAQYCDQCLDSELSSVCVFFYPGCTEALHWSGPLLKRSNELSTSRILNSCRSEIQPRVAKSFLIKHWTSICLCFSQYCSSDLCR